jgi:hypothetical protein
MPSYKLRDISNDYLKPIDTRTSPPPRPLPPPVVPPPLPLSPTSPVEASVSHSYEALPIKKEKNSGFLNGMLVGAASLFVVGVIIIANYSEKPVTHEVLSTPTTARAAVEAVVMNPAAEAAEVREAASDAVAVTPPVQAPDNVETVAAPLLTQGMVWNVKTLDFKDSNSSYDNVQYLITQADQSGYTIQKMVVGRPSSLIDLTYDNSLNLIGGRTGQYTPALHYYDFPLWVGKTWNVKSEVANNKVKDVQIANGEVKGWEKIKTPFGEVDALKIVVNFMSYKAGEEVSRGLDISWYAPSVGRAVLSEEYNWDKLTAEWVKGREHHVFDYTSQSN